MMNYFFQKNKKLSVNFIYSLGIYLLIVLCVALSIYVSYKGYSFNLPAFFSSDSNHDLKNLFTYCLSNYECSSFLLWIMILLSLTPFGLIFPFIIVSIKSYGIGLILCNLYLRHHLKGVIFGLLIVLPGLFISLCSLLSFSFQAMKFSFTVFKSFLPKNKDILIWNNLRDYMKYILRSICILFSSFICDFLLFGLFWKFFLL